MITGKARADANEVADDVNAECRSEAQLWIAEGVSFEKEQQWTL